ncbi:hypothetical protein [Bacillus solimangrovi]|nr:hypothetical protein [Bacillus solimangrovi]
MYILALIILLSTWWIVATIEKHANRIVERQNWQINLLAEIKSKMED